LLVLELELCGCRVDRDTYSTTRTIVMVNSSVVVVVVWWDEN
jgi:hypothetical protein